MNSTHGMRGRCVACGTVRSPAVEAPAVEPMLPDKPQSGLATGGREQEMEIGEWLPATAA
jgi:hypothetical protein